MAGTYIHIPFCRQACHYCNFHFSTSLRYQNELTEALLKEIELQATYLDKESINTIYFGGGTPSLMPVESLEKMLERIRLNFSIAPNAEITLEANPDDMSDSNLARWKQAGINRLSIGIQSFFEEDLLWMNRAHNAKQAKQSIEAALQHFNNISIDLIYGVPGLTNERWEQNVMIALKYHIPHLSCYALTVEPKTPLDKQIRLNKKENTIPEHQSGQFLLLMQWLGNAGYEHYEISNFALPGKRSRHNSSYWKGEKYLGIGPSSHSYDGKSRQWNIANNQQYIQSVQKGIVPFEKEELSHTQKLNEHIMISLRTTEGLRLNTLNEDEKERLLSAAKRYTGTGHLLMKEDSLILTDEGKLLADGIAAALFF